MIPLTSPQVQVKFFLDNWGTIRTSDALANVWQEIRTGRHPGFEEGSLSRKFLPSRPVTMSYIMIVWPVIMSSLQVMPASVSPTPLP